MSAKAIQRGMPAALRPMGFADESAPTMVGDRVIRPFAFAGKPATENASIQEVMFCAQVDKSKSYVSRPKSELIFIFAVSKNGGE